MPTPGHFVLHSRAEPPLAAGDYVLRGTQQVAGGPTAPIRRARADYVATLSDAAGSDPLDVSARERRGRVRVAAAADRPPAPDAAVGAASSTTCTAKSRGSRSS